MIGVGAGFRRGFLEVWVDWMPGLCGLERMDKGRGRVHGHIDGRNCVDGCAG